MSSRVITIPNLLTLVRMALIPVFVGALYYQRFGWALAVFVTAGVTDGLDGLFARRFNQYSQLGQILDPIADKVLLVTSFITLPMPPIMAAPAPAPRPSPPRPRRGPGARHKPRRVYHRRRGHDKLRHGFQGF